MGESKSVELKVGILVAGGLILFIVTTLLLNGGRAVVQGTYPLKIRFDSVSGLASGSVVQLLGVTVGNVSKVDFAKDSSQLEVTLNIEDSYQSRITKGSRAEVRTQGALGDKYIYITPGVEKTPIEENGYLETDASPDIFLAITKRADDFQKIFDVISELDIFLKSLNANGSSAKLVPNLVASTEKLHRTLTHFENISRKLDDGEGTLGALINDSSIHDRMKDFIGGSNRGKGLKNLVRETLKD